MSNKPIGIFDSGIGGLTVAKAIKKQLPEESIVYFGDTAHVPYGEKSPELIRRYSKGITKFLMSQDCKAIVIACNTASAHAFEAVVSLVNEKIPVINVIDPVVNFVGNNLNEGKVGVIGTKATISSKVYVKRLKQLNPNLEVVSKSAPLLVPMIEEGFYENNISKTIIHAYLSEKEFKNLDALILGCTHYPLIKREVGEFYNGHTVVYDSSKSTALELEKVLRQNNLLSEHKTHKDRYVISDYTDAFNKAAELFFEEIIEVEEIRLWD